MGSVSLIALPCHKAHIIAAGSQKIKPYAARRALRESACVAAFAGLAAQFALLRAQHASLKQIATIITKVPQFALCDALLLGRMEIVVSCPGFLEAC
jgi:hypothetical protein